MNLEQAAERFEQYRNDGRLLRGAWTGEQDGKQLACWLAALSPEVESAERAEACPSALLPQWFALLVPWMDDNGTEAGWFDRSLRFGQLLRRMPTLGAPGSERWERLRIAVLCVILDEAASHVPTDDQWGVRAAIAQVKEALNGRGDLAAAGAAAGAAAVAAISQDNAGAAATGAAWAAWAAARAAWAARAAAWADAAAWAARAAAISQDNAGADAAGDRIVAGIFAAIEAECDRA